jgi:RNA polymerase sigma-70 factor, ECF subfamily
MNNRCDRLACLKEDEGELLRHAAAGDRAALEVLFTQNQRALYLRALRLLGNADDAEDALQEGLLAAYRNLRRFQGRSQFATWLTRIVINAALMQRRGQRAHPTLPLEVGSQANFSPMDEEFADGGPSPEDLCTGNELAERLQRSLADLSPPLRHAFELREMEGFSAEEAAKVLGVSRNALKARLWRARRQLASQLSHVLSGRAHASKAASSPAGSFGPAIRTVTAG